MVYLLEQRFVAFKDYLEGERDVHVRSEYIDGYIYAMAGASERHNTITHTFGTAIDNVLGNECCVWQSDMKVIGNHQNKDFAYYPDVMVACGENKGNQYARTNPVLIIDVLSPSTERTDLSEKLNNYLSIDSLLEYVVVSQNTPYLRIFRRRCHWRTESYYAEDTLYLESVGLKIKVEQIYRRVRKEVGLGTCMK